MSKKNIVYLFIAIALGSYVIGRELKEISLASVYEELIHMNWAWLIFAVFLMLVQWGLSARITQLFLKRSHPELRLRDVYRVPLIEHLFNAITPFSTGGQPAQIITLVKMNVDAGVATSASLMKFVVYQTWIVFNFIVCIVFGYRWVADNFHRLSYLILFSFLIHFVIVFVLLMIMYHYKFTETLATYVFKGLEKVSKNPRVTKIKEVTFEKMTTFYEESQHMKKQKKVIAKASLLTILQLMLYYSVPYFILLSLGVEGLNLAQIMVLHAFIILIISLFPVPGGAGGAEFSFNLLFGTFVTTKSKLVLAILLWRIVTYYSGIIFGMIALLIPMKGTKDKRD